MNASPGAKITKIALEDPTEKEMELMSLDKDEKILVLERIRYADGKPVQLELNKFPESFSFLFSENLNDSSLYEILKKHNIILDPKNPGHRIRHLKRSQSPGNFKRVPPFEDRKRYTRCG